MKSKKKLFFNFIFLLLITSTNFSQAHNSFNGGCKNHCDEKVKVNIMKKKSENINKKNQFEDSYSCLRKSLCRG